MSSSTASSDFDRSLEARVRIVNDMLDRLLAEQREIPEDLQTALRYTLSSPGKRIRSALV